MPGFTGGRADFPLFPRLSAGPCFGKDNHLTGLPEKGKSVVLPWAGFQKSTSYQWGAQSWSKEAGSPLAASTLVPTYCHLLIRVPTPFFLNPLGFLSALAFLKQSVSDARGSVPTTASLDSSTQSPAKGVGTSVIKTLDLVQLP